MDENEEGEDDEKSFLKLQNFIAVLLDIQQRISQGQSSDS